MNRHAPPLPRKRGLMLRLLVLFVAVALAVTLQAGEGKAAGHRAVEAEPAPQQRQAACAPRVALRHPALPAAAQPNDARSSEASSGCSRSARSGL